MKELKFKKDCRYFLDYKPCKYHKQHKVICENCKYYDPLKKKILLINLEAIGDVLRTTAVLKPLKEKYPGCHITWLTTKKAKDVLSNNPYVDEVLTFGIESALKLQIKKFDILINLEKAPEAAALATLVKAEEKKGFGLGDDGFIFPFNKEAKYLLDTGLSDLLKKESRKTQQEVIFDIIGLKYNREKLILNLPEEAVRFAEDFMKKHSITESDLVIGFNTGCSNRLFLDRKWTIKGFVGLSELLYKNLKAKILLFGGPGEVERNKEIIDKANVPLINTGHNNTLHQFAALISKCNLIVTGDTLAVHIATALNIPIVVMFGCVTPHEIEIYDNGRKVVSDMDCICCYKEKCEKEITCMDRITSEQVFKEIEKLLNKKCIGG